MSCNLSAPLRWGSQTALDSHMLEASPWEPLLPKVAAPRCSAKGMESEAPRAHRPRLQKSTEAHLARSEQRYICSPSLYHPVAPPDTPGKSHLLGLKASPLQQLVVTGMQAPLEHRSASRPVWLGIFLPNLLGMRLHQKPSAAMSSAN